MVAAEGIFAVLPRVLGLQARGLLLLVCLTWHSDVGFFRDLLMHHTSTAYALADPNPPNPVSTTLAKPKPLQTRTCVFIYLSIAGVWFLEAVALGNSGSPSNSKCFNPGSEQRPLRLRWPLSPPGKAARQRLSENLCGGSEVYGLVFGTCG